MSVQQFISQIIHQELGKKVHHIEPIIGKGTINHVYHVKSDTSDFIIRMNDSPDVLSIYQKERWCMGQAQLHGIPSPKVIAIGQIGQITYMIQSFVQGDNGEDSSVDKQIIWETLGQYAKRIQMIPVSGFGEIFADRVSRTFISSTHDGFDGTWHGFIRYNINSLTENDPLLELGIFTRAESKRVQQKFESLLSISYSFGLTHGDLSLKNTIVDDKGDVILLDWGCAAVHLIPYWELLQLFKSQLDISSPNTIELHAFLRGYGIFPSDFQNMQPLLQTLLLLDACDKLRWAIDCQPDCIPAFVEYAKKVWQRNVHGT
jgi:aminoglycoside phosphotransferase (APT) family kinase protein